MKTITFAILAILIFGVAVAPAFSGTAIAQSDEPKYTDKEKKQQRSDDSNQDRNQKYTDKEKKQQRSDDSKQQKAKQRVQAEERKQASEAKLKEYLEKKEQKPSDAKANLTAAKQLQQQRADALKEQQQISQEQRDEQERIDRAAMQKRLDKINDRSPMTDALNRLNDSKCGAGTVFDSVTKSCVLDVVDSSDASTNSVQYLDDADSSSGLTTLSQLSSVQDQNDSSDNTVGYFENLRETIAEQKIQQHILFTQISLLLNLIDSMCDDRVIVASVSDGKLRCIDSDRAFNMQARGLVTLVQ